MCSLKTKGLEHSYDICLIKSNNIFYFSECFSFGDYLVFLPRLQNFALKGYNLWMGKLILHICFGKKNLINHFL
jgi:hypothetical protein